MPLIDRTEVLCLAEDTVCQPSLRAEHGLCLLVSSDQGQLLFDTGQSRLFLENATVLQVNLAQVRAVAISHGHYDHGGGLPYWIELHPEVPVYLHPSALEKKLREGGSYIGLPEMDQARLSSLQLVRGHHEILPGMFLDSDLFSPAQPARYNQGLFVDGAGRMVSDPFRDEQYLCVEDDKGLILITGCSHRGITEIVKALQERYGLSIHSVVGGLHIQKEEPEVARALARSLHSLGVKRILAGHCTGKESFRVLQSVFPGKCRYLCTGSRFEI